MTAALLYGDCERPLFMELPQEDWLIKPECDCEADQVLTRDARCPTAVGESGREDAEGLGLHRDEVSAGRLLPQGERCGDHPPRTFCINNDNKTICFLDKLLCCNPFHYIVYISNNKFDML